MEHPHPGLREALAHLFGQPSEGHLGRILLEVESRRIRGGEILFEQGDPGDGIYVVLRGCLAVWIDRPGEPARCVRDVGRLEPIGERALLTGDVRSATVVARRDSELAFLSNAAAERVLREIPGAALPMMRALAARLEPSDGPAHSSPALTLCLLPADPGLDAAGFARSLADAWDQDVRVILEEEFAKEGRGDPAWLHEQEERSDVLLLVAGAPEQAWTQRCLRQSDRAVHLGSLGARPPAVVAAPASPGRFPRHGRPELVLLRPPSAPIRGTATWLTAFPACRHHHLRLGDRSDLARAARLIGGRAWTLVLSGGGARGFAHAGVLRALRERGWPIDAVGGTSAGSAAAVAVALGMDDREMVALSRAQFVDSRLNRSLTVPLVSLLSARRLEPALRALGDVQLEDLPVPCFAVSANLTRAAPQIHTRGPAWRAVRASVSLPGIFPPVFLDGDVLVDGGIFDNMPVATMQDLHPGRVVASDISRGQGLQAPPGLQDCPPGRALLVGAVTHSGRTQGVPPISEILSHSIAAGSLATTLRSRARADVLVMPQLPLVGMLDFSRADEFVELGYAAALEALDRYEGPSADG
jgi:NTE family protein